MHIKYEQKISIGSCSKAYQNINANNFKMRQNTNLIFTRENVLVQIYLHMKFGYDGIISFREMAM